MPARVRDVISRMAPYSPGKPLDELERELGIDNAIKLASNENPWGPSPRALEAARQAASRMNMYPDAYAYELTEAISKKLGMPRQQVVLGNGSDELITNISAAMLEDGDSVLMADPGFSRYEAAAQLAGAHMKKIAVDSDAKHDLPAMADAAKGAKITWIANPNNPTGTIVRKSEFESFLSEISRDTLVVLDEAYFEFVDDPKYPDGVEYVRSMDNVACLRTFSKTYGLAGARVGYGIFPAWLADALARIRAPFNVNIVAQAAALAAIDDQEYLQKTIEKNAWGIREISRILTDAGGKVAQSYANFVWAHFGPRAQQICELLLHEGVIVRSGRAFGKPECIRVSVGTPDEVRRFEETLSRVMGAVLA